MANVPWMISLHRCWRFLFFFSYKNLLPVLHRNLYKVQTSSSVGLKYMVFIYTYNFTLKKKKTVLLRNTGSTNDFRLVMIEVQAQPREKCMVNMFGTNPQRADDSASGVNLLSCLTIYERNFFLSFF